MQTHSDIGNVMTTSNHDNAVSVQSQQPKLGLFSSADKQTKHHLRSLRDCYSVVKH